MSSVTIVVLVLAGIVALMLIGFLNHGLEKSKLDKARRKADLHDRQQRCSTLSSRLPGQLMTTDLKQLLNHIELHVVNKLTQVDANNSKYTSRSKVLREQIAKGAELPIENPPLTIVTDEQIKDVRFQLESLQAQIIRSVDEKILTNAQGKQWLGQIKHMMVMVYIDYFNTLGRQFVEQKRPNQARLVFERGIQYLKKQKDPAPYKQQLKQFEMFLERANALVLESTGTQPDQVSDLTEGLEQQHQDNDWQKKQIYD